MQVSDALFLTVRCKLINSVLQIYPLFFLKCLLASPLLRSHLPHLLYLDPVTTAI
jgi:hypothetical protein